jgi:V/A-type H+-transporting ATPase subunit D
MAKIKLTKGELKRQRDALRQYERYLPTLQLKKQQLQLEILQQQNLLSERRHAESKKLETIKTWVGLFAEPGIDIKQWLIPERVITATKNVAGVDLPVFQRVDFVLAEYDLFTTPLWIDFAIEAFRSLVSLGEEIKTLEKGMDILKHELRITTQRVNLFEKVKIPEAIEAIRLIKIYIGDQMANAVGRSKIAKRKIEEAVFEEVLV